MTICHMLGRILNALNEQSCDNMATYADIWFPDNNFGDSELMELYYEKIVGVDIQSYKLDHFMVKLQGYNVLTRLSLSC